MARLADRFAATDWRGLGCDVRVVVVSEGDLAAAREVVDQTLAVIDRACSRFRDDSELVQLGRGSGGPMPLSPLLADAIAAALYAATVTGGDVDPTLGAELEAVGYDRDFVRVAPDGPAVTVVSRPVSAWRRIELDRAGLTVTVPVGVRLDLGATAKAYAADLAARRLEAALDGRGALVALGGDIAIAGGPPPDGWSVRVQDVTGPAEAPAPEHSQTVAVRRGGVATSSTSARRWVRGGLVMHHILDPRTGVPVVSPWRTVSAAAATCLEANIATTAAIVRGTAAVAWFERRGVAGRFVSNDGDVVLTGGWPAAVAVAS